MKAVADKPIISWEILPSDFPLPEEPVDNLNQIALAAGLLDSLETAKLIPEDALVIGDYGICATVDGQKVVKAPDWVYIPKIEVSLEEINRSYTPHVQGSPPAVVMEFLSDAEGTEYSNKSTYPPGKWFFYEQVLQVPIYVIFEPKRGRLEVYKLNDAGRYKIEKLDKKGRYWLEVLGLYLGVWQGTRGNSTGNWLRFWDEEGQMLPWASEFSEQQRQQIEQEKQRAEQEKQRAEQEKQRAEREKQRAEQEKQLTEQQRQRAEREKQRAEREKQRAEQEKQLTEQQRQRAEQEKQHAEQEKQRAERLAEQLREQLRKAGIEPEV